MQAPIGSISAIITIQPEFIMTDAHNNTFTTRMSLLLKLKADDPKPRELAWAQFHQRYAPIIAGFARKLGAKPSEIDDVVQEVMVGFYAAQPVFQYDPKRGRFRGYLKVCTMHVVRKKAARSLRDAATSLENIDPADDKIEQIWNDVWQKEHLKRAIDAVRTRYENNATFQAFERVALKCEEVSAVAAALDLSVDSVYKAKQRVSEALKKALEKLEQEEG
jgi:RNA polymerase sigma factor (sigma-70 family)